ncbi:MAG: Gfo/Idh/MocA family oxidoreductase [Lentisphaerae bacterium]|nr:Gfo/Idh/MocA family oxidoreductase [Lentisphaerota bacterium]
MKKKLRYVQVGTGQRSWMYTTALMKEHAKDGELCALCDTNQHRMDFWNKFFKEEYKHKPLPTYKADQFDRMIAEIKPDKVIVTSMDRTHHKYICRAMELGCDVITEKPMTMDAEKCQQIIDTQKRTGRHVTVTFNYRYSPRNTKIKEIIKSGLVGDITSVHFEWLLNTRHGADYFRRWHRCKNNSGGLLVHKATHHFDLVNWWIDSQPETVFSMAALRFYGKENAESRGCTDFYYRCRGSKIAAKDPFRYRGPADPYWKKIYQGIYFDAEVEDQYYRDQSVFGDGISIEDNMGVIVRYKNKAILTYSLNAHAPWEGYRVCFNGTKGRLEFNVVEVSSSSDDDREVKVDFPGAHPLETERAKLLPEIIFQPHWGKPYVIDYPEVAADADHGGGDVLLLNHVFQGVKKDPLGLAADYVDGARSILIGIAANKSMASGQPVEVASLVHF